MARTETGSKGNGLIALVVLLFWAVALTVSGPSFQAGAGAADASAFVPAHARTGLPPSRAVDAVDHRGVAVSQQRSGDPDPGPTGADTDSGSLPVHRVFIGSCRHVAAGARAPAAVQVAALRTADARAPPFHS